MTACRDFCVPMCWVESQAGSRRCFYQFEGESKTTPQEVIESEGVWRCLAVSKLRQVEACAGGWHTGPRFGKQTCIDEVDYDVDAYPEPSPQNGQ